MSYKPMEKRHLALADKHITQAEQHIAEQKERIKRLAANGYDTTSSEKSLAVLQQTLQAMNEHREVILAALDNYAEQSQLPYRRGVGTSNSLLSADNNRVKRNLAWGHWVW
jgi:enoyl-CoA hydratase/carnithine racemase